MMHLSVYSIYTMRRCEWTHRDIHRGRITRMKRPILVQSTFEGVEQPGNRTLHLGLYCGTSACHIERRTERSAKVP